MLFIPGELIALVTFPGIIVHELGHLLLCRLLGVKVHGWCLFRAEKPQGFVIHEKVESVFKNFLITFGPFFVNSLLAIVLAAVHLGVKDAFPLNVFFLWLAFSVGMHAFPSTGDGKNLWDATIASLKRLRVWNAVFLPFVAFIYIGALLSFFWVDLFYAGALFTGTQAVLSAPMEFSGSGMSHKFENSAISFEYPWGMQQKFGAEYDQLKADLNGKGYDLYFLNFQGNNAVAVIGAEGDYNASLKTWGMVTEALEYGEEEYLIQKSGIAEMNGRQWYEIDGIAKDDQAHVVFGVTLCPQHKIEVKVVGTEFNHVLFEQITKSFKCKEGN